MQFWCSSLQFTLVSVVQVQFTVVYCSWCSLGAVHCSLLQLVQFWCSSLQFTLVGVALVQFVISILFLHGCLTHHATLDVVDNTQSNMVNNLFSCGINYRLEKAFDRVDHNILPNNLSHYGARGIIHHWFSMLFVLLTIFRADN